MGSHSFSEMAEPKVKVTTLFYYIYKYYLKFNRQFCWSMNKLTTKNRQNIFIGYKQWKLAKIVIKNKVKDMNKRTMENRENIFIEFAHTGIVILIFVVAKVKKPLN